MDRKVVLLYLCIIILMSYVHVYMSVCVHMYHCMSVEVRRETPCLLHGFGGSKLGSSDLLCKCFYLKIHLPIPQKVLSSVNASLLGD